MIANLQSPVFSSADSLPLIDNQIMIAADFFSNLETLLPLWPLVKSQAPRKIPPPLMGSWLQEGIHQDYTLKQVHFSSLFPSRSCNLCIATTLEDLDERGTGERTKDAVFDELVIICS
jgi:hypothetical protein